MDKLTLAFEPASDPIASAVTKFGGQPFWVGAPEWPCSRETGEPMRFIGQIALDPDLFGGTAGRMAYLFMTDGEEYVDGTWEPEGGENAVIIQPDGRNVATQSLAEGPTLYDMREVEGEELLQPIPCEFACATTAGRDDEDSPLEENKVGGLPVFLQGEEYPSDENWRLLLQLDATSVPFYVNFGDAGVGYAFLSGDGRQGKFLWQCA